MGEALAFVHIWDKYYSAVNEFLYSQVINRNVNGHSYS